jgi:hypothetical protein
LNARIAGREYRRPTVLGSLARGLSRLIGGFGLTARARLLPRAAPWIAAGVWLLSMIRFI